MGRIRFVARMKLVPEVVKYDEQKEYFEGRWGKEFSVLQECVDELTGEWADVPIIDEKTGLEIKPGKNPDSPFGMLDEIGVEIPEKDVDSPFEMLEEIE